MSRAAGAAPPPSTPTRLRLLGGEVDVVTPAEVMAFAADRIAAGRKAVVANHNLHSLHLIRRDAAMRAFYASADLVEIDSTPLILWGRLLGRPVGRAHRCTYLDWREDFWRLAAERGWRVFYLGGAPGVAAKGAEVLADRWPGVRLAVRDGFFDMDDPAVCAEVIETVNAFRPDVVFVGMGMPRQERWIAASYDWLDSGVVFPIGAAFDYEAGAVPTPPRWSGRVGLEWLFRFAAEPRRLFARYFVEPWSLIGPAIADLAARGRAAS
ncbi:MAG: WecB/TagA/CpsF family glycosyltransferase [Caulobacteraceae bacterium]|nr:WecB/TagA/CpsF family glycosyltransferase [Caulobacteraceae bacterium]